MNKAEFLRKHAEEDNEMRHNNIVSIDISNSENNIVQEQPKTIAKNNDKKMMSFRVPQEVKDNIDKYAYIQRLNKQEVIIMCFETFFKDTQVQDILKQYDELKENK